MYYFSYIMVSFGVYKITWINYSNHGFYKISENIQGFVEDAKEEIEILKTMRLIELKQIHDWVDQ